MEIRNASPSDIADIVRLMREFAVYENLEDYCEITAEKLFASMFGDQAFVEGLIATANGGAFGYALFYPSFASFRGERGFYLEDIYIGDEHRGKGIGEEMLRHIARTALERGFERIDFQVLDWNTNAIEFYKKLGAVSNQDESHFKFSGDAFAGLAGSS